MRTRLLILVKTYPTLSNKYDELVCTAGMKEDGTWVRIYPIPFRKLDYDQKYKKYQWIELDLIKNTADHRPESYRPVDFDAMTLGDSIGTEKGFWRTRKAVVLKRKPYTNMNALITEAQDASTGTSLAVFKPTKINDFIFEDVEREWDPAKLKKIEERAKQLNLFKKAENPFKVVNKLPYRFSYVFEDDEDKKSTLMIEDWEIGQLYWNVLAKHEGDEEKAREDVRKKYFEDFAKTKDLYFFLGTTKQFHSWSKNPFIIIVVFYPKADHQLLLF